MRSIWTWTAVACAAVLVSGTVWSGPAAAQEEGEAGEAPVEAVPALSFDEQIDAFFARLAAGEPGEAIEGLYAASPWMDELSDQVSELKSQFVSFTGFAGAYLGQDELAEERVSDRFVYRWHLVYFERQPLQVHFSFYRPRDRWVVFQFAYEEAVTALAKERARTRQTRGGPE